MKKTWFAFSAFGLSSMLCLAAASRADDPDPAPPAADAPVSTVTAAAAPITQIAAASGSPAADASESAKFMADAKWEIAGYNNEEIVYSILVTNQDSRIIHCSAELHGYYFDNGEKRSISDRQSSTIFPGKQVHVGHWMGMDEKSGATYKVSCRAI
jgi:hypothetical protein